MAGKERSTERTSLSERIGRIESAVEMVSSRLLSLREIQQGIVQPVLELNENAWDKFLTLDHAAGHVLAELEEQVTELEVLRVVAEALEAA